ncbi:hypothetical protein [Alicyclobacillus sp. ALC3]|uniref:hypothetical protein n=1 Tax=Alicyclobacillus sp. ALC3 TaxID=2796143 RepID=UPI0023794ABF|nr:hypothetical protein [Alicyclobacillus sp. ALC3]WDL95229.1 hypothetical protein JC200_12455 [Alicyclobacillus sp. ALC3]
MADEETTSSRTPAQAIPEQLDIVNIIPRYRSLAEQPSLRSFVGDLRGWQVLYTDHGNSLLLFNDDGPMHYLDIPGSTLLKALADVWYLNLRQLKTAYFTWTGHRSAMPLPAGTSGDLLVAFKTRHPRTVNDGSFSYIAGGHIADIIPESATSCKLVLQSGAEIPVLWSLQQCIQQVRTGGMFLSQLIHERAIPDASALVNRCQPEPFLHRLPAHRRYKWY